MQGIARRVRDTQREDSIDLIPGVAVGRDRAALREEIQPKTTCKKNERKNHLN
jgi:hypothetical protein